MSLRFNRQILPVFLRVKDGQAGRSASKAADFRHLRRKAEKFLFLALFFILYMNEDEDEYELFYLRLSAADKSAAAKVK